MQSRILRIVCCTPERMLHSFSSIFFCIRQVWPGAVLVELPRLHKRALFGLLAILAVAHFVRPADSYAAEVTVQKVGRSYILKIDGAIQDGDFKTFIQKTSEIFEASGNDFRREWKEIQSSDPAFGAQIRKRIGEPKGAVAMSVALNSAGGNVLEAMKIGRAVREMLIETETGFDTYNTPNRDTQCMSACFLIWASGIERTARARTNQASIGIHRLFFDRDYYKNLPSSRAEKEFVQMRAGARIFLRDMGVPEAYVEKMFQVSSADVYLLSPDEVNVLSGKTPYFEELLFSKCGGVSKQQEKVSFDCGSIGIAVKPPPSYCSSIASDELLKIEATIAEASRCWRAYTGIERWNRMSEFLSRQKSSVKKIGT